VNASDTEPTTISRSVRLPAEEFREIERRAEAEERTISNLMRQLIRKGVRAEQEQEPAGV
jgi:hypothetical protein